MLLKSKKKNYNPSCKITLEFLYNAESSAEGKSQAKLFEKFEYFFFITTGLGSEFWRQSINCNYLSARNRRENDIHNPTS